VDGREGKWLGSLHRMSCPVGGRWDRYYVPVRPIFEGGVARLYALHSKMMAVVQSHAQLFREVRWVGKVSLDCGDSGVVGY
jgi:hypothetical protein